MSQLLNFVPEAEQNLALALPFDATDLHAPAGNTAAVVTEAADASRPHVLAGIYCGYSATPTGGNIKVEDGSGNTVFTLPLATAGPHLITFEPPRCGTKNTALIVTLAAGGGAVVGALNINVRRHL